MNKLILYWLIAVSLLSATGCASWAKKLKAYFNGSSEPDKVAVKTSPRFSDTPEKKLAVKRQYGRMTRDRFESESQLHPEAGSLWTMEGQGSYLFAQNRARVVGDLLTVKIEGSPRQQLSLKAKVIEQLLAKIDAPRRKVAAAVANKEENPQTPVADANANAQEKTATDDQPKKDEKAEKAAGDAAGEHFSVQAVPTRIVEQLKDGSYRVRGTENFMIGKREYAVIVQGIVRPEDFDEEGVSAGRLLDPQFDIVSNRRGM